MLAVYFMPVVGDESSLSLSIYTQQECQAFFFESFLSFWTLFLHHHHLHSYVLCLFSIVTCHSKNIHSFLSIFMGFGLFKIFSSSYYYSEYFSTISYRIVDFFFYVFFLFFLFYFLTLLCVFISIDI